MTLGAGNSPGCTGCNQGSSTCFEEPRQNNPCGKPTKLLLVIYRRIYPSMAMTTVMCHQRLVGELNIIQRYPEFNHVLSNWGCPSASASRGYIHFHYTKMKNALVNERKESRKTSLCGVSYPIFEKQTNRQIKQDVVCLRTDTHLHGNSEALRMGQRREPRATGNLVKRGKSFPLRYRQTKYTASCHILCTINIYSVETKEVAISQSAAPSWRQRRETSPESLRAIPNGQIHVRCPE